PGGDAARPGTGAVHQIELDLDQLVGARVPVHLHERGGRPRVAKIAGQGPRGPVADLDVGDVDAAAHDVGELAAGLAKAPLGDGHDGLDLLGDVADPSDIALPVDR